MIIEALYPELCNLFGDAMNAEYIHRALPDAELIKTSLKKRPVFISNPVDFIYLGSMTETGQSLAINALRPHVRKITKLINNGTLFLITGNAMEIFGTRIENEDGTHIEALGLFNLYAKRQMMKRYSSIYLGNFVQDESASQQTIGKSGKKEIPPQQAKKMGTEDKPTPLQANKISAENKHPPRQAAKKCIEIVGFKSQFAHSYCDEQQPDVAKAPALFETVRGAGRKPNQIEEGVRINNFFATYVLGPILILNPQFTRYILNLLGAHDCKLPYEKEIKTAYRARLSEFKDPKTGAEY